MGRQGGRNPNHYAPGKIGQPALGRGDDPACDPLPAELGAGELRERRRGGRAALSRKREPVAELPANLLHRPGTELEREQGANVLLDGPRAGAGRPPRGPNARAESGSAPQAAASAATIPNDSGNVLGTTWAEELASSCGRSSCSRRPVKYTRSKAPRAARR